MTPEGVRPLKMGVGLQTKSQALVARTRSSGPMEGNVRQPATLNTINPQHLPVPDTYQTLTPISPKHPPLCQT